jgi:hypothetical protein
MAMITGGSPVTWPQKLAAGKSEEQTDADLAAGGDGGTLLSLIAGLAFVRSPERVFACVAFPPGRRNPSVRISSLPATIGG